MQLLYVLHHNLLEAHVIPTGLSWLIVIGALYGALRLAIDLARVAAALLRTLRSTSWRIQMTPGRSAESQREHQ